MDDLLHYDIREPEVEKSFISTMLNRPQLMGRIGMKVPPEALVETSPQAVYVALLSLYAKGIPFDRITICNELLTLDLYEEAGQRNGVGTFFDNPLQGDPVTLGNLLIDYYSRRLEVQLGELIQARAYRRGGGDDNDMAARLARIQTGLQELQKLSYDDDRNLDSKDFGEYYETLLANRLTHINDPRMVFAWPTLHKASPSVRGSDLVVLVADSGAGKTSLLENQGEFLWKEGFHGALYHLELSTERMVDRRMCRATGLPMWLLQDGRKENNLYKHLNSNELTLVRQHIADQAAWPGSLAMKYCPAWTMAQICADIRQRHDSGPLDFIMIDYFNEIRIIGTKGNYATLDMGNSLRLLKGTLGDLGLVGWMAAQIDKDSKKSKKKILTVKDGRDIGAVLDDMSNVGLSLNRPIGEDGTRTTTASVYVTKCNSGPGGMANLYFDGARYRLISMLTEKISLGQDLDNEFPDFER